MELGKYKLFNAVDGQTGERVANQWIVAEETATCLIPLFACEEFITAWRHVWKLVDMDAKYRDSWAV